MFGSEAVTKHVYNVLRVRAEITALIGTSPRIYDEPIPPNDYDPASGAFLLHYDEQATYPQDVVRSGVLPSMEQIRYVVRFVTAGASDIPLRPALHDAFEALVREHAQADVTIEDDTYHLDIGAAGEWPKALGTTIEGGVRYRQRGFYLAVDVGRA